MNSTTRGWLVGAVVLVAAAGGAWWARYEWGWFGESAPSDASGRTETAAEQDHAAHGEQGAKPGATEMADEEPRAAIEVGDVEQTRIGLKAQTLTTRHVQHTIRAVGTVTADERLEAHVHTRLPGYVEKIDVDAVGDQVRRGQVLYRLYSPELVSTQEEYVASVGRGELSARIAEAALKRLSLWDVPGSEIARLKKTKKVQRTLAFRSPVDGFVLAKNVLLGMYVMPEMELYHIADLSRVWVIVTLYEHELGLVGVGDEVKIDVTGVPDRVIQGKIGYIYPDVDLATRTARARVEVENPDFVLKPGMYATALLAKDLGEALVVPEDAVIDTGVRKLVFVKSAPTQFEPRELRLGPRVEGGYLVREGVEAGEEVVVRASFLIDAESRLQAALQRGDMGGGGGGHAGHAGQEG